MKKTILLNASIVVVLLFVSIIPTMQPLPLQAAPLPPTTIATPTPQPTEPGLSTQGVIPPSPDHLPPEVEQARARQAMGTALTKYLRYWGPRYQVAPIEVAMEGEWAHGVAQWLSATRTLSGPIHILAHRLPDGTWQALLPGSDELYLQWLDAVPERLVPASEKSQLRAQAAEADALQQPRVTPVIPAVTRPSDSGLIQLTTTPTPQSQPNIVPLTPDYQHWLIYEDVNYGFTLRYPLNWFLYPTRGSENGDVATITNYPLNSFGSETTQLPSTDFAKVEIGVFLHDRPITQSLQEWAQPSEWMLPSLVQQSEMNINGIGAIQQTYYREGAFISTLYIPRGTKVYFISITTLERSLSDELMAILDTFTFTTPYEKIQVAVDYLYLTVSQTELPMGICPMAPSGFRLPFDGNFSISNGPGEGYHTGSAGEAIDFPMNTGTAVRATEAGDVTFADWDSSGYGWSVRLHHDNGMDSWYAHLSQIQVSVGQQPRPSKGQQIALSGNTGTSTGPHLHFHVKSGSSPVCIRDLPGVWWNTSFPPGDPNLYSGCACYPPCGSAPSQCRSGARTLSCGGGSDTTPPDGDITSPSEGATISSRTVYLAGWAQDNVGGSGFNHAHFTAYYNGSWRQVGPDFTSSPFGFDWDMCNDGVPDGSVTIGLDIWDNAGNQANSPHGVRHFAKNYNCSPPPTCNPSADQIALYANTGYGGSCVTLGVGNYPNPSYLSSLGNDNAESIRVGSNVQAILYEHDNYQGRSETFTNDDSSLGDNYIGANSVSSVKVQWRAQPPAVPALQSPSNGAFFNEGQGINLSWSATGNEYYGEIWGGPGGTLTFGWQSGTSKDIGSQWAGYTYSWHVKARNGAGESGWSSTWTFTVKPAAPSSLNAQTASCNQVNLYWNDNSGNEEGYKVYRNGSYVGQVGMNGTSYQDTGLNGNTSYSYYVRAFRGSIESDASNTVDITTPSCPPPMPDLRPYAPSGYPYPVVPSSIQNTHEVNALIAGQTTYFDWYFINSGGSVAPATFYVELWVDDTRYVRYPQPDFYPGWVGGFDDWAETIVTPGWHTVRLIADPDNTVTESDETNNVWQRDFYWAASAPYFDDMEGGGLSWTTTGLWHLVESPYIGHNGSSHAYWYGQDSTGNYDTGTANSGDLTSPPIYIPSTGFYLRFWYGYETETQGLDWDQRWVQISVDGGPFNNVLQLSDDPMGWWLQGPVINLSGYAGHTIQVRFHFDTIDEVYNTFDGWYIDDFDISTTPPPSCADSHEPNNTPAQATAIAYGQTLSADICPGGDYDFYTFAGTAGDKVVIDIDAEVNGSLLDSYIFLLDSDGTNVLRLNDDEPTSLDSKLGYQLPHDGTYYIKLKAWNHPSVGGTDYFYTIHLLTDGVNPSSAAIISPGNDAWLDPTLETITVAANDDESGINRVEFLWHDADWENSEWVWLGADYSSDDWSWDFDTGSLPDQRGGAFYVWAFDWVGNWTGAGVWNLGIDRTPPTVAAYVSLMYGDAPFRDFYIWWYGSDNLSDVANYDVQYRDGPGGVWTDLLVDTTNTSYRFVGLDGHTYYFRARARDHAGNQSDYSGGNGDTQHTVQTCHVPPDTYEADNTAASARWIRPDAPPQTHNFHNEGDQDWVRFYAAAGITYTLATTSTSTHADTMIYLYGGDGTTLIDYNDDYTGIWPLSRLDWRPSTSGFYLVKVQHWDPWAYGCTTEYGLSITGNEPTPFYQNYLPLVVRGR